MANDDNIQKEHSERLLHYVWKHKMFPLGPLATTDGLPVEVISPGTYNSSDAGPDFFNAKVRMDGMIWVGNVEIHVKASDWYRHHHDRDSAYDNVILHVVETADVDVETSDGKRLPTLVVPVDKGLLQDYEELLHCDRYPPCHRIIPSLPSLKVRMWMTALQTERLEQKTLAIEQRVRESNGSWEDACFRTLARSFGFGTNGEAFDIWSREIPMGAVARHRDELFHVQTMFLGMAGMLDNPSKTLLSTLEEGQSFTIAKYQKEFAYLRKVFNLTPMEPSLWAYLRMRPQNFPHVRLLQLASMYHERRTSLESLLECATIEDVAQLYGFGGKRLELLVINTVVPMLFAYGRNHSREALCDRALDFLDSLKAEDNAIVRMWEECGMTVATAGDSQALIQLKKQYCDRKDCLRCRFGYDFLSGEYKNEFLKEPPL